MIITLFRQSDVPDPYRIYAEQLLNNPVYWDGENKLWALYSYKACKEILSNPAALVPQVATEGLNDYALAITGGLARLSNAPGHAVARKAALLMFQRMKPVSARDIMHALLPPQAAPETDWVNAVAGKLPVMTILAGFEIESPAAEFIAGRMQTLVQLMQPVKTGVQIPAVNTVAKDIYYLLEHHITSTHFLTPVIDALVSTCLVSKDEALTLCISNLAGLLIQSYDAGRGILSNALLHLFQSPDLSLQSINDHYLQQCVTETLRFDPPVHSTRRIAGEDMVIGAHEIKKGQMILVVMAAANRDAQQFEHPGQYDIARFNNDTHLTFGFGMHACMAKAFVTQLATETLQALCADYPNTRLAEATIEYEPLVNVRLPKQMLIELS